MTRNRRFTRLMSWLLSVSMVASLVVVAPVVASGSAGSTGSKYPELDAITNKTVVAALEQMIDAGRILSPEEDKDNAAAGLPERVAYLDFEHDASVVGEIDIAELKGVYQDLERVQLSYTNAWILNQGSTAGDVFADTTHTFVGYNDATGVSAVLVQGNPNGVVYRSSQNSGNFLLGDLLAGVQRYDVLDNTTSTLSTALLDADGSVNGTITFGDQVVTVNGEDVDSISISSSYMDALPIGTHTFHLSFEVAYVDYTGAGTSPARLEVDVDVHVRRNGFQLTPDNATATWGDDVTYTLRYLNENMVAQQMPGQLSDYGITYQTGTGVTLNDARLDATSLTFTAHVGAGASAGTVQVTYGTDVLTAHLDVTATQNVASLQLHEYQGGRVMNENVTSTTTAQGAISVLAGTPIASADDTNIMGENAPYSGETIYLLFDYTGVHRGYLSAAYREQVRVTVANSASALRYEVVTVPNPDGDGEVVGVVFTGGSEATQDSVTVWVDNRPVGNNAPATEDRSVALTVNTLTNTRRAQGYEIFAIPGNNVLSALTQSELNANIAAGKYESVARYELVENRYQAVEGGAANIVQSDYVTLVATVYYSEDGVRCVLGSTSGASLIDWYDMQLGAESIDSAYQILLSNSTVYAQSQSSSDGYTLGLILQGGAVDADNNDGLILLNARGEGAVLELQVRAVEEEIVDFIFVPEGYSLGSNTTTYSEALAAETEAQSGDLYRLNVSGEDLVVPIGSSATVTVVAVTNHNTASADHEISNSGDWDTEFGVQVSEMVSVDSADFTLDGGVAGSPSNLLQIVATSEGGLEDAKAGNQATITLTTTEGDSDFLGLRLGPSQITGVYLLLTDSLGNTYTPNETANGVEPGPLSYLDWVDSLPESNTFQTPEGRGVRSQVISVYAFSNTQFYGTGVDWEIYRIETGNLNATSSNMASGLPALNLTKESNYIGLYGEDGTAATPHTLTVVLNNSGVTTQINLGGALHSYAENVEGEVVSVNVVDAIPVGIQLSYDDDNDPSTSNVNVNNGDSITGKKGDLIPFSPNYLMSDGDTVNNALGVPAESTLNASILLVETDGVADLVEDQGNLTGLLRETGTADMQVEYTYTINGKEGTVVLGSNGGSLPAGAEYSFDIVIGVPDVVGFALVAYSDDPDILVSQSGQDATVEFVQGETYKLYPVAIDGSWRLDFQEATSAPTTVSYDQVLDANSVSFLSPVDFSLDPGAVTFANETAIARWAQREDSNGIYFEVTMLSENVGSPYTVTLDPTQITLRSTNNFSANIATTSAEIRVTHAVDIANSNVVDIRATNQSASIQVGGTVSLRIEYVMSSTTGGGDYVVNPVDVFTGEWVMPGMDNYGTGTGRNQLQVEVYDASGQRVDGLTLGHGNSPYENYLTISGWTSADTYTVRLRTLNNAGVWAPSFNNGWREVQVEVEPQHLTGVTIHYGQTLDVRALTDEARLFNVSYTEANGAGHLDANQLSVGLATMVENASNTTTVNIYNEDGDLVADLALTLMPGIIGSNGVSLSVSTSRANRRVMGDSEQLYLVWNVVYTDTTGLNPSVVTEPIEQWDWQQADDNGITLTLNGEYITANSANNVDGAVVYLATYDNGGSAPVTQRFWAYIDQDYTPSAGNFQFVSARMPSAPVVDNPLTLDVTERQSVYVRESASNTWATITAANSSNENVLRVVQYSETEGDRILLQPVGVGTATVTAMVQTEATQPSAITLTVNVRDTNARYSVSGTVQDSVGNPISNAQVTLGGQSVTTDVNGTYTIGNLTTGNYTLEVQANGYLPASKTVSVRYSDLTGQDVMLESSYTVSGTVVDSSGNGLPGLTVNVVDGSTGTVVETVSTNATGNFTVTVGNGNYTINVSGGGSYADNTGTNVSVSGANATVGNIVMMPTSTTPPVGPGGDGGGTGGTNVTVSFDLNGGSGTGNYNTMTVLAGSTITLPTAPTREGYTFIGWSDGNTVITGSTYVVSTAVTLTAQWEKDTAVEPGPTLPFVDVPASEWYYSYIQFVTENGYMNGISDTVFGPNDLLTRAHMVQILYNMEGRPAVSASNSFTDVPSSEWYASAVIWASENGLVMGYSDGSFLPTDNITREDLMVILYRYAQFKGVDTTARADLNDYVDADRVSGYAQEMVAWALAEGLVQGRGDGQLSPKGTATRAEMATFITRYIQGQ